MCSLYRIKLSIFCLTVSLLFLGSTRHVSAQPVIPFPPLGRFVSRYLPVAERLIVYSDQQLLVYSGQTVAHSADGGQTWSYGDEPAYYADIGAVEIAPDFANSQLLWAGLSYETNALRFSEDAGDSWKNAAVPLSGPVVDIAVSPQYATDHTMYIAVNAGAAKGVFRTVDAGQNWQNVTPGIEPLLHAVELSPAYPQDQTLLLLAGDKGVLRSRTGGATWEALTISAKGVTYANLYHLHFSSDYAHDLTLFAATSAGVMKSTDNGKAWALMTKNKKAILKTTTVPNFGTTPIVFALELTTPSDAAVNLLKSPDGGKTWQTVLATNDVVDVGVSPNYAQSGAIYALTKHALYVSHDQGNHWQAVAGRFPWHNQYWSRFVLSPNFAADGVAFVHSGNNLLLRTTDAAATWTQVTLPELPVDSAQRISMALSPNGSGERNVFLYINQSLYTSTNLGDTWSLRSNHLPVAALDQVKSESLQLSSQFALDHTMFLINYEKGVYRSTDGGQSWNLLQSLNSAVDPFDGPLVAITGLALAPTYPEEPTIFVTIYNEGVYRSTDAGASWERLDLSSVHYSPDYLLRISPTYPSDKTLFIAGTGSSGGGLGRSTDGGDTWVDLSKEELAFYIKDLALSPQFKDDQTLMISTELNEPLISEDAGATLFRVKGMREDVSRLEIGTGFTIALSNNRIMPLVSQATTIMQYRWDALSLTPMPGLICFTGTSEEVVPNPQSVAVATSESSVNNWYILSKNLQGVSVAPTQGTIPGTFVITPLVPMASEITGELTINVPLSFKQNVSQPMAISNRCQYLHLPVIAR